MRCNLCGSGEIQHFLTLKNLPVFCGVLPKNAKAPPNKDLELLGCARCGLVFQKDIPRAMKLMKPIYEKYSKHSTFGDRKIHRLLRTIKPELPEKGRALEIGCFDGYLLKLLKDRDWDCYGIDPAEEVLEAREFGVKVKRGMFRKGIYKKDQFDLVVMMSLIEHLPDPKAALLEAYRIMKPGGLIAIVPDTLLLLTESGMVDVFSHQHITYFGLRTMKTMLEICGFRVLLDEVVDGRVTVLAQKCDIKEFKDVIASMTTRLKREFEPFKAQIKESNAKVAIWGAGGATQYFLSLTGFDSDFMLVDRAESKHGKQFAGYKHIVHNPKDLLEYKPDIIIVTSQDYQRDIIDDIRSMRFTYTPGILKLHPEVCYET